MWMKKANNFQKIAQVQHEGVAQLLLDFFANFSLAFLMYVLLIKKRVSNMELFAKAVNCSELQRRHLFDRLSKTWFRMRNSFYEY